MHCTCARCGVIFDNLYVDEPLFKLSHSVLVDPHTRSYDIRFRLCDPCFNQMKWNLSYLQEARC